MRKRIWAPLWAIALITLIALGISKTLARASSGGFTGVVLNMGTGRPVPGAGISAAGQSVIADPAGCYVLPLSAGTYEVRAEAAGYVGMSYAFQRVDATGQVKLDFEMIPRNPNPEEAAAIDAKMMSQSQEPPEESDGATLQRGYGLSSIANAPATIRVLMPDGAVVALPTDEYLQGVVPHEMPPYWPMAALRAQAVAARSYATTRRAHLDEGADVCTTTHCQVWNATHYDTTDQAVNDTHGVVAKYGGDVIYAFFFAHCDGHTRDANDVWGGDLPYCRAVTCPCGYTSLFGHGVGMCQQGARALAEQGYTYVDILKHFYTGVEVPSPTGGYLAAASVQPTSGDENTQFTFQATYVSAIGDLPVVANVIIDDRAHALTRVSSTTNGTTVYQLVTRLPAGVHAHSFYFDDGRGHVYRVPTSGTVDGPTVTEPDSAASTPTPIPTPDAAVLAKSITHSTATDWTEGSFDGVSVATVGDGALILADGHVAGTYTSTVLAAPLPFMALGATWYTNTPDESSISLEVRTSVDGSTWDAWRAIEQSEDDQRADPQISNLLFGDGVALQYRAVFWAGSDGAQPVLENLRLVCIDSRAGPTATELAASRPITTSENPPIVSREDWGADETIMTWPPEYREVRAIVLHHTATEGHGLDPAAMVRAIYYYHAAIHEWGDIGYNYLIDALGNIYEGRAGGSGVVGCHAQRFNWGSTGIALIGDYRQHDPPSPMLDSLTGFLAWQCASHSIDPEGQRVFIDTVLPNVMSHRDCGATVCPGDRVYALLPTIRSETLAKMAQAHDVPPDGSVSVPEWSNTTSIPFVLTTTNTVAVQFSNDWVWEGEELHYQENTGYVISDTSALNGWARVGRVGDPDYGHAGYWYGPYTCELPGPRDYRVYFRLKNPNSSAQVQLANLDIADDHGCHVYAARTLVGTDFAQDDTYQEFRLDLSYGSQPIICDPPEECGLEFRTEFLGMGDLFLDRITVFDAPQPLASPTWREVRDAEGPQTVIVRFLDATGNATDCSVTVNLDMTSPQWQGYEARSVSVGDALSGLDTATAAWAESADGGTTWSAWQPISLTASSGITVPIEIAAPQEVNGDLRFHIQDVAGNLSVSDPLPGVTTPTPTSSRLVLPLIMTHALSDLETVVESH